MSANPNSPASCNSFVTMNIWDKFQLFRYKRRLSIQVGDPWYVSELYVILDSNESNNIVPQVKDCSPNPVFTKIKYLNSQPLHLIENNTDYLKFSNSVLGYRTTEDLKKLNAHCPIFR